jgi:filamentous hemagglutinin family protein
MSLKLGVFLWAGVWVGLMAIGTQAQVVPDETLGGERSQVRPETIRGVESDRIEGGARRGGNLFHSFERLNIGVGRGAYFNNPDGVENIFGRVTGNLPSDIQGTLGVIREGTTDTLGTANLFLMNPNGIVFGQGARLDLGGSFVGTTADAIGFGGLGVFGARSPGLPSQVLTVNPSAFLFGQVPAAITNRSRDQNSGLDPSGRFNPFGLRVADGESFLLLGGDINIDGGGIAAFGGQIELGSIGGSGLVGFSVDGDRFKLNFSANTIRSDVTLKNNAGLIVSSGGGGEIGITSRGIDVLQDSTIEAGILRNLGSPMTQAGSIDLNATGAIAIDGEGSHIYNTVRGTGNGGDLSIQAQQLSVRNGAQVEASIDEPGRGRSGNVLVRTVDLIEVIGSSRAGELTFLGTDVAKNATGEAGDVTIETRRFLVEGAQVGASIAGTGIAGNLTVLATDSIELRGEIPGDDVNGSPGGLFALVDRDAEGIGGTVNLETNLLRISDGSKAQAISFGNGNSGDVNIT